MVTFGAAVLAGTKSSGDLSRVAVFQLTELVVRAHVSGGAQQGHQLQHVPVWVIAMKDRVGGEVPRDHTRLSQHLLVEAHHLNRLRRRRLRLELHLGVLVQRPNGQHRKADLSRDGDRCDPFQALIPTSAVQLGRGEVEPHHTQAALHMSTDPRHRVVLIESSLEQPNLVRHPRQNRHISVKPAK